MLADISIMSIPHTTSIAILLPCYNEALPIAAAHSAGFQIQTELTVHAPALRMPVAQLATVFKARAEGSARKLNASRAGDAR